MSAIGSKVRGGLFAAAVLGSMSFGAAGVFARPAQAEAPPGCDPVRCVARHGPFARGDECLCAI
jgi:hypothetical protein